ncbi:hypothetical protein IWW34DRAFT_794473 [Fusarium oxysporum f. sp. albedinis]|nr:hypothetical protein IWW34DRAFT_794473 [Fusarium oxysporum f. sp. albedinis]KAK2469714.1 hypothetical protein H9L39_18529 [Fusarium oxysporum f. sp. albedinis]
MEISPTSIRKLTTIYRFYLPVQGINRVLKHTTASMASEELLELLKQHDLPIKDAYAPFETMATWCALKVDNESLARMKTNSDEFCTRIGDLAFNSKAAMLMNRILLIGDDMDIHNWDNIMRAYTTRCRPGQDEYVFENVNGLPLTPYMKYGHGNPSKGGKMVSNCLFPMEYEGKRNFRSIGFRSSYPRGLQEKIEAGWTQMRFDAV